jgi:hypothetical protein
MSFNNIRDYLSEKYLHLKIEWRNFQRSGHTTALPDPTATDEDLRRDFLRARDREDELRNREEYEHNATQTFNGYKQNDLDKSEPFEFFTNIDFSEVPDDRLPSPGIYMLPMRYHKTNPVYATESVPETGFQLHPLLDHLTRTKYPRYVQYVTKLIRPLGTTDATFTDFNREQVTIEPITDERKSQCLSLIHWFLGTQPYLPIHFVDYLYAKLPLSTGTGYHNRHSYRLRTHAKYAHNPTYREMHTSKGYFFNSFLEHARTLIHHIKSYALPFNPSELTPSQIRRKYQRFFLERPTLLYTRNHISDKDGRLKQRPVYAVDDLFLAIEAMLTFPLLVLARKMNCCIMYGLETIRGGNHFLDSLAKTYKSFFTIDWSTFDQRVPRIITDIYYTDFLESLIVISHGYQPTYEYPSYPDLTPEKMFERITNLLHFLHTWYNNMVFLTADGYAYLRTTAGIPSGQLNTQYLDSFANLFLLIDGFIEFGIPEDEIRTIVLFVMGDDNSGFTPWQIGLLHQFINWFESYAFTRYNMILSSDKSVITNMRNRIQTLSYECNFGMPKRPIPKLVSQLCYPEHGPNDKYMSFRAIGIAYAAAGSDPTFHNLCEDVYHLFKPFSAELDSYILERIIKHLPGQFKMMDSYLEMIDLDHFPTLHEVRRKYQSWQGPLSYAPKWNYAHFINDPHVIPQNAMTVLDYRIKHSIARKPVEPIFEA